MAKALDNQINWKGGALAISKGEETEAWSIDLFVRRALAGRVFQSIDRSTHAPPLRMHDPNACIHPSHHHHPKIHVPRTHPLHPISPTHNQENTDRQVRNNNGAHPAAGAAAAGIVIQRRRQGQQRQEERRRRWWPWWRPWWRPWCQVGRRRRRWRRRGTAAAHGTGRL
jgi:hypothetical protein